jgi:hypothetical protein
MLRFGLLLITLSFLPWLAIPFIPLLPFLNSVTERVSAVAGLCVLAEILFWTGLLCAGRETWKVVKLHGWKKTPKRLFELLKAGHL